MKKAIVKKSILAMLLVTIMFPTTVFATDSTNANAVDSSNSAATAQVTTTTSAATSNANNNTAKKTASLKVGANPSVENNNAITKTILSKVASAKGNITIDLPYAVNKAYFSKYVYMLETTYPEYFIKFNYQATMRVSGNAVIAVSFKYDSGYAAKQKKVNAKVNQIVKGAKLQKTTQKKIEYVENELDKMIVYNKTTANCRNAYGALIEKRANCMGYSSAFALCMKKLGINVKTITNSNGTHIWNQVKIGKAWYNVDSCWDDGRKVVGKVKFVNAKKKTKATKRYTTEKYLVKKTLTDKTHK